MTDPRSTPSIPVAPEAGCVTCKPMRRIPRREQRQCHSCGSGVCDRHTFIRVDESNESITRNSPLYCGECAERIEPRRSVA